MAGGVRGCGCVCVGGEGIVNVPEECNWKVVEMELMLDHVVNHILSLL